MRYGSTAIALLTPVLFGPVLHAQDRPLAWDSFAEVYRAGGLDAPEWAQFTRSNDIGFDGRGNLYVTDGEASRIVKIGPDGRLVTTIGRAGEGPGEFENLYGVLVWRDGSFAANDGGRDVFHLFDADGNFERMVRWRADTGELTISFSSTRPMRPGPRPGIVYAQGTDRGLTRLYASLASRVGADSDEISIDERVIEVLDLGGDVVTNELILEAWRPPRAEGDLGPGNPDMEAMAETLNEAPHFEPTLRWDVLPGGAVAYVDSSTYEIRIVRDGATATMLTRPITPQPVTRGIESDVRERMLRDLEEDADAEPPDDVGALPAGIDWAALDREANLALRKSIENMEFYPEIPAIDEIRSAWDGSVWVERQTAIEDETGLIDVFGPDGDYRGTLARDGLGMPDAFGPDGLIAYWEFDEMDVPRIVVYRLPASLRR